MKLASTLLFVSLAVVFSLSSAHAAEGTKRVYFGMYGQGPEDGIYVAELDLASGVVSAPRLAARAVDPSFLAFDPCAQVSLRRFRGRNFGRQADGWCGGLCRRQGDGQPHPAQRATLRGGRSLLPDRRQIGKECPRRQLRRGHGRRAPHRRDGPLEAGQFRHRPSRQGAQSAASGRPARPLDQRRPGQSLRLRGRPGSRPHLHLSLRPGGRKAHAERSARRR